MRELNTPAEFDEVLKELQVAFRQTVKQQEVNYEYVHKYERALLEIAKLCGEPDLKPSCLEFPEESDERAIRAVKRALNLK